MNLEDNIVVDPAGFSQFVSIDSLGRPVFNKEDFLSFLQTDQEGFHILLNWPEKKILEVGSAVKAITGYSRERFACEGLDFCASLYHPCEKAFLKYVYKEIEHFYCSLAPEERLKYQYTFDITLCKPDGKYEILSCQLFCLKMDEAYNPLYVAGYLTSVPVTDKKYVTLTIKKIDGEIEGKEIEFRYKPHFKLTEPKNETTEMKYNKAIINHIDLIQDLNSSKMYSHGKNVIKEETFNYDQSNLD